MNKGFKYCFLMHFLGFKIKKIGKFRKKKSNLSGEETTMKKKVLSLPLGVKHSIYQLEMDYTLNGNCPLIWWLRSIKRFLGKA